MNRINHYPNFNISIFDVLIFQLVAILVFLPSVTFSLISAEIFPWAGIFVVLYMRKIESKLLLVVTVLLLSVFYGLYQSNGESGIESIRSFVSYLNPLLIFSLLIKAPYSIVIRMIGVLKRTFYFMIALGFLQLSGFIEFLDPFFKFLIPRGYASSLDFMGGRGVTLLSSEPARAGIELVFIYIVIRTVFLNTKEKIVGDLLLGAFLLIFIKSATSLAFYVVFIFIFYRLKLLLLLPVGLVMLFPILMFLNLDESRTVLLVKEIFDMSGLEEVFFTISNNSGHRVTSIIAGYNYGFMTAIGGGVGNWMSASVDALNMSGVDLTQLRYFQLYGGSGPVPIRCSGYVTNLMLDIGIAGCIFFFYYLFNSLRKFWCSSLECRMIILLFIVKIFLFGSVGNPVAWVATVLALRFLYEKPEKCSNNFLLKNIEC